MGATRPASGIKGKAYTLNKGSALITRQSVNLALMPDAGRVAPISACVLWVAFSDSVWCLSLFARYRFFIRNLCFLCSLCSRVSGSL